MTIAVKIRRKREGEEGREGGRKGKMPFAATEHNLKSVLLYKNIKGNKADKIKCNY